MLIARCCRSRLVHQRWARDATTGPEHHAGNGGTKVHVVEGPIPTDEKGSPSRGSAAYFYLRGAPNAAARNPRFLLSRL